MSPSSHVDADCPSGLPDIDCRLLRALQGGLSLSDRPFAELGQRCGLSEDKVLERLHELLGRGEITHLGPLAAAGVLTGTVDALDTGLLEAIASGLPLLPRPYEAVAAMLGVSESEVRTHLQGLLDAGRLQPMGAVLRGAQAAPPNPQGV